MGRQLPQEVVEAIPSTFEEADELLHNNKNWHIPLNWHGALVNRRQTLGAIKKVSEEGDFAGELPDGPDGVVAWFGPPGPDTQIQIEYCEPDAIIVCFPDGLGRPRERERLLRHLVVATADPIRIEISVPGWDWVHLLPGPAPTDLCLEIYRSFLSGPLGFYPSQALLVARTSAGNPMNSL